MLTGTDNLSESQELVERAELGKRSVALAHALADERDGMVEYVAAGRTSRDGAGVTEEQRSRVDRQVTEIRRSAPAKVSASTSSRASARTLRPVRATRGTSTTPTRGRSARFRR